MAFGEEITVAVINPVVGRVINAIRVGYRIVGQHRLIKSEDEVRRVDSADSSTLNQVDSVAIRETDNARTCRVSSFLERLSENVRVVGRLIRELRDVGVGRDHAPCGGHRHRRIILLREASSSRIAVVIAVGEHRRASAEQSWLPVNYRCGYRRITRNSDGCGRHVYPLLGHWRKGGRGR